MTLPILINSYNYQVLNHAITVFIPNNNEPALCNELADYFDYKHAKLELVIVKSFYLRNITKQFLMNRILAKF